LDPEFFKKRKEPQDEPCQKYKQNNSAHLRGSLEADIQVWLDKCSIFQANARIEKKTSSKKIPLFHKFDRVKLNLPEE